MKPTFLTYEQPLLTLLFSGKTPAEVAGKVTRAIREGAEGFCLQTCQLEAQYRNREDYRKIFSAMENRPVYVTNYRHGVNETASDQTIAEGLVELAESGATLCDVMGDLFGPQPGELTVNPEAVQKQKQLIRRIHQAGAEVIMSSHVLVFTPAERVLEIALAQQERGAYGGAGFIVGVVQVFEIGAQVADAHDDVRLQNLRITNLLKKELKTPFLFLSGGECQLHRRIGPMLGCCMYLCSLDDEEEPKPVQPMLRKIKAIRDNWR